MGTDTERVLIVDADKCTGCWILGLKRSQIN